MINRTSIARNDRNHRTRNTDSRADGCP